MNIKTKVRTVLIVLATLSYLSVCVCAYARACSVKR